MSDVLIYAEDLARDAGWTIKKARRILRILAKRHGPTVVFEEPARYGVRYWTTVSALSRVMPSLKKEGKDIYDRVFGLESELKDLSEKLNALLTQRATSPKR